MRIMNENLRVGSKLIGSNTYATLKIKRSRKIFFFLSFFLNLYDFVYKREGERESDKTPGVFLLFGCVKKTSLI